MIWSDLEARFVVFSVARSTPSDATSAFATTSMRFTVQRAARFSAKFQPFHAA
jgi:hypothetical protein